MKRNFFLPLSLICCLADSLLSINPASAQVTTDGTTSTTVDANGNNFEINNGDRAGGNLFHSFGDFSVPNGGEASFNNSTDISNILSRVTGGNISNINGLIRANGSANLFLINPAGIVFGEGARLDIGGSFLGSTADSILFEDGEFSAVNNLDQPILTINAPIGLNFRDNPDSITNNSVADDVGLQVSSGATLALLGGDVNFTGGIITAPGANVQLGGLSTSGTISLDENFNPSFPEGVARANVSFSDAASINVAGDNGGSITVNSNNIEFTGASRLLGGIAENGGSDNSQAGDISLNATGAVSFTGESHIENRVNPGSTGNSGNINVNAQSLSLTEGGYFSASTFGTGNAGDINVDITGAVELVGETENEISRFSSVIAEGGKGDGGDITINADSVTLTDGALINTDVQDILGDMSNEIRGAGNITINASSFSLLNDAAINSSTNGLGNAGSILIDIDGNVEINNANIFGNVGNQAQGNGNNIEISAGSLSILQGGQIQAGILGDSEAEQPTGGQGDAGNISIDVAGDVLISGNNEAGSVSGIFSDTEAGTIGNAGDIEINGSSFTLSDGALLTSSTSGTGDAGNITVNADNNLEVSGSRINGSVQESAIGQGGQITLTGKSISLSEGTVIGAVTFPNGEEVEAEQVPGGNIELNVSESLSITGNSGLTSSTQGKGDAGNITINGEGADIVLENNVPEGEENADNSGSGLISSSSINAVGDTIGNAGNITITAKSLNIRDGGGIDSNAFGGEGNGGNITVNVTENVEIADSLVSSSAALNGEIIPIGNAGNITINAGSFSTTGDNFVGTVTFGLGEAGDIRVDANSVSLSDNASLISSSSNQGNAGSITVDANSVSLSDNANLTTGTSNEGDAGDITVNANSVSLTDNSDLTTLTTGSGNAGNINIRANNVGLSDGADLDSSTFGAGNSGEIRIIADGVVTFSDAGTSVFSNVEAGGTGDSLGVFIDAQSLDVTDGAQIQTLVRGASETNPAGQGNAGDININVRDGVNFTGSGFSEADDRILSSQATSILASGATGSAGNINITGDSLSLSDGADINTSTSGTGNSGEIRINADSAVTITDAGTTIFSNVEAGGTGDSLGVFIDAQSLDVTDGAQIQTLVRGASETNPAGQGNAGDININVRDGVNFTGSGFSEADDRILSSQATSTLNSGATGSAGNIIITGDFLSLTDGARLSTLTSGNGDAGKITLNISDNINIDGTTPDNVFVSGIFNTVESGAMGNGGEIEVTTNNLSISNGAVINAGTFGEGDGGTIFVNATESIILDGTTPNGEFVAGISSAVEAGAKGNGGNVEVTTTNLSIANGATINAGTFGQGDGGSIFVNASESIALDGIVPSGEFVSGIFNNVGSGGIGQGGSIEVTTTNLSIANGAGINAGTSGEGDGGSIFVNASESITLDGTTPNGEFASGIFNNVAEGAKGNGGNVEVTTTNLSIANGAAIGAATFGQGNGGDVTLNIADRLTLRENSTISTRAANNAQGGNITINAENGFVVAFPSQNEGNGNDITAFSNEGVGGNINITAEGVLGLDERDAVPGNETNDIDASGVVDGVVEINTPNSDAIQGASKLPNNPVDPGQTVAQACSSDRVASSNNFTVTGKGGIPADPAEPLDSEIININGETAKEETTNQEYVQVISTSQGDIIPAQGVEVTENGDIILTAYRSNITSRTPQINPNCNRS